ncbi:MAG: glycosyltransferase family 2 protein [Pseudomonadota bacterium]
MISIVVMAHNEETSISRNLQAILAQDGFGPDDRITVLENGSTDRTGEIVESIAETHPCVSLCSIALGDKANAWSFYTFNISVSIEAEAHVFVDGDVVMRPGSLKAVRKALTDYPDALAVSGLPYGGRTADTWRARVLREHGLPGNFYVLRGSTLEKMRSENWCLPVGYMGDDTFLQWILKRQLNASAEPNKFAIRPVPDAGFDYESIPNRTLSGLWMLYRRQRAYAMRDIQSKLLSDHVLASSQNRPPRDITALYANAKPWTALFGPFGRIKPFKLRKLLFLYTYMRTRKIPQEAGTHWYEGQARAPGATPQRT